MSGAAGDEDHVRLHLLIGGRVQGVFFRASTRRRATELDLTGWVRNTPDGRVEVAAEGFRPACEALRAYCDDGPPTAHVDTVDKTWARATGEFTSFRVRH